MDGTVCRVLERAVKVTTIGILGYQWNDRAVVVSETNSDTSLIGS